MMNNNEQSSSQRTTVANPTLQRIIDNNAAMQYSNQMIISQSMDSRPPRIAQKFSDGEVIWVHMLRKNNEGTSACAKSYRSLQSEMNHNL
ncbi:hypothetical protein G6F43_001829 [Rhizopus delemar]|nr:hypothetical protein G6F43_001829 [Rhizopus delemar]